MRLPAAAEALDRREHTDFSYIDRSLGIFEGAVFSLYSEAFVKRVRT